jgi:hypothetical protein
MQQEMNTLFLRHYGILLLEPGGDESLRLDNAVELFSIQNVLA